jgi:hypothetical protein
MAWMFLLCCTVKDERQSQDIQDKEVQIKYRESKKEKQSRLGHGFINFKKRAV